MTEPGENQTPRQRQAERTRRRLGIWLILGLALCSLGLGVAGLALTHLPVPVPQALLGRIEARANAALAGRMRVHLGSAALVIEEGFAPEVRLAMVQIAQPSGLPLAVFPEVRTRLRPEGLLQGRLLPQRLQIGGASVALYRAADGRIDLDLGDAGAGAIKLDLTDPLKVSDSIEALFATPALRGVTEVSAEDLHIRIVDERAERVWEVSEGRFRLSQNAEAIALTLGFDVGQQDALPAQVALTASTSKHGPAAEFGAAVTGMPAADLAVQSPALAVLRALDAPISGTLRSGITEAGTLRRLDASLHIGPGALRPSEAVKPVAFDAADLKLAYRPHSGEVEITRLDLQSRALRLAATGQVRLRDFEKGLPREALAQVQLSDIASDPEGLFEKPARFSQGALDLRLRLDPFRVDLGQVQLVEGKRRISAAGQVLAGPAGWRVAMDAAVGEINSADLLALWPKSLVPPTREWLAENVATGELRNVRAALRLVPATPPRVELGYEFRGAEVKVLRTLPPVREGRGFAGITENKHTLMVEEGTLRAPSGGQIEVADSVMTVPDIREKPARAEVKLVTRAPIPAALALLDEEPFRFMSKAGQGTDIATGWAEARTRLRFQMKKQILTEDVDFEVAARLTDVMSDKIVPGHKITAPRLTLTADRAGMVISGAGLFDIVPFQGRWAQRFGPEARGLSRVDGFVEVTPAALDHFRIALPKGAVQGEGWGSLVIDLHKGQPPAYRFASDLKGLRLSVPEIGWSKAAPTLGRIELAGHLGPVATVDSLKATAPGLSAEGRLQLSDKGFEKAIFGKLAIGSWFDGAVDLVGRGKGRGPDVVVRSGRLDLRKAPFGGASGAGGGGAGSGGAAKGGGNRIEARLDRLTVSGGIALAPMAGQFTTRGGFSGDFRGRINGGPEVTGAVVPAQNGRAAVRITGPDAGAALAAAGVFSKARGGTLDLTLMPVETKSYDGRLAISNLRVQDAPVLASMLSAASVIGLLEQLNGDGLLFTDVAGRFHLSPQGVSVTSGQAVGASMGVTMSGNYYPDSKAIDMQGVVTPFYLVNAIGQIFARKGEGLFGFNYRMRGTSDAPRITINPLSIFTPGMFREIFRRAPPKLVTE
ncbi:AsmA-like C-terminal region-containing protein [Rhodobacter capsulatus]|uniref:AsmA-like C-terminal region n=1 Tax=Rhodobacter capsulatus TaxID=1061 RepID=A0A1G7K4E3_RHOCA|nr:AsmA-like C-terminal region-containing protein [Rhodobacter capsulatus]WER07912.1 AsmA-like C-terminal region-containing protein [Rhodobacter capsulatus]SDF32075.1 AsmA-like C-terminal region [Rhodobacter capsulatus]